MRVGVPKEIKNHEYRVGLTPPGVQELTSHGHEVLVEAGAGAGASISDEDFAAAGAYIADRADQVWDEADLLLKVKEPVAEEFHRLRQGQILFTYLHLAANRELTEALLASGVRSIAYETVELPGRRLPLLAPMSEVAGRMSAQVIAHQLERAAGGRGVLMGGVTGVAPAKVVVLGAGMAGLNAAIIAAGMQAEVVVLDTNVEKLRSVDALGVGRITALMSTKAAIDAHIVTADAVVGSVLIPGAKAPRLVTADHIRRMKPGSVVVDISVDQGGCFETSRVTTHDNPTYVVDDVVHYCVGNMPGAVPNTSTYALTNVTLPYVVALADGAERALAADAALLAGVSTWDGHLTSQPVAEAHGLTWTRYDS